MAHAKKMMTALLVVLLVVMVAAPASGGSVARAEAGTQTSGVAGVKSFARCVWNTVKQIPAAKKLSPKNYQKLEQTLNDATNAMKGTQLLDPRVAAVFTGAKIGKFIGFNFVWYVGVVQSCWSQLRK